MLWLLLIEHLEVVEGIDGVLGLAGGGCSTTRHCQLLAALVSALR
jgi:hypothetical protein